jgi:opacity protein-like surface antigen
MKQVVRFRLAAALVAAAAFASAVPAAASTPPVVRIVRVAEPPTLEQYIDGTNGNHGAGLRVSDFRQREPNDGMPVSRETVGYLSYDDENLYVIFVCRDDPSKVRAHMAKREAIMGDDLVGIVIDTFRDYQRAYVFLVNPLGVQLDGITTEGQNDDYSFDTLWHSEGRLTHDGYVVKIAIPFKSLRFRNAPTQNGWGISLTRAIMRENEMAFWPRLTRSIASFTSQMATVEGLEQISPGRNMQLIPYGSFAATRFLEDRASLVSDAIGRTGLDAKVVLRDAVTIDAALNPDFSQVESDEPQVTTNQRWEVFFPEKRPFFIENAGIFQTPQNLFFSRRVADPQVGLRMTAKAGHWTFGGIASDDRAAGQLLPESDRFHGRRAAIGVARVQREFQNNATLGALVTSRDFGAGSNRVVSIDGRMILGKSWNLTGQAIRSLTDAGGGVTAGGSSFHGQLSRHDVHVGYALSYLDRSPDFHSDLGFIPRVDIRQVSQMGRYYWRPRQHWLTRFGPYARVTGIWDHSGRLQEWTLAPDFELEFRGQTNLEAGIIETFELFAGQEFRQRTGRVSLSTEWLKWLAVRAGYNRGTRINYYPAAGQKPFVAAFQSGSVGLTVKPSPQLRLDQTYLFSHLSTLDGAVARPGADIYNNHILRSRANYQFTRALSVRAIVDYRAVLPNGSLIDLERQKHLRGDFLVTYMVNPWTAFYAGITDTYENFELAPDGHPSGYLRGGGPTMSTGRQLFVKMSYLLRN